MAAGTVKRQGNLDALFRRKLALEGQGLSPAVAVTWDNESVSSGHAVLRHLMSQAGTGGRQVVVGVCRPSHLKWCSTLPPEVVICGLQGAAPSLEDVVSATGPSTTAVVLTEVGALGWPDDASLPLSVVSSIRRSVPSALLLLGMNTSVMSSSNSAALLSLCTLVAAAPSALQPLPPALAPAGHASHSLVLGEVEVTDRSISTGKAGHSLHPFVVRPDGSLNYKAGMAAAVGEAPTASAATPPSLPTTMGGSSIRLTRTAEEDAAKKAVALSYAHQGGQAAVVGESTSTAGAGPVSSAPRITLDLGDVDSDTDSSDSDEED